jgi:hypothetical protein
LPRSREGTLVDLWAIYRSKHFDKDPDPAVHFDTDIDPTILNEFGYGFLLFQKDTVL